MFICGSNGDVCIDVCGNGFRCPWRQEEDVGLPTGEADNRFELPDMGSGNKFGSSTRTVSVRDC